jgi:prevent-host-death family protein
VVTQVNIFEAKNRLSQLIKAVQRGDEVVIANRGEPVARLVAISPVPATFEPGSPEAILDWSRSRKPPRQRRTAEEIEAEIEELRASWD